MGKSAIFLMGEQELTALRLLVTVQQQQLKQYQERLEPVLLEFESRLPRIECTDADLHIGLSKNNGLLLPKSIWVQTAPQFDKWEICLTSNSFQLVGDYEDHICQFIEPNYQPVQTANIQRWQLEQSDNAVALYGSVENALYLGRFHGQLTQSAQRVVRLAVSICKTEHVGTFRLEVICSNGFDRTHSIQYPACLYAKYEKEILQFME